MKRNKKINCVFRHYLLSYFGSQFQLLMIITQKFITLDEVKNIINKAEHEKLYVKKQIKKKTK